MSDLSNSQRLNAVLTDDDPEGREDMAPDFDTVCGLIRMNDIATHREIVDAFAGAQKRAARAREDA